MYNKTFKNKIKFGLGLALCAIAIFSAPAMALTTYAANPGDVEVCADYKEWVYKIINGKVYKALLNNTTGLYETDWIYVCDWPEGA